MLLLESTKLRERSIFLVPFGLLSGAIGSWAPADCAVQGIKHNTAALQEYRNACTFVQNVYSIVYPSFKFSVC